MTDDLVKAERIGLFMARLGDYIDAKIRVSQIIEHSRVLLPSDIEELLRLEKLCMEDLTALLNMPQKKINRSEK